MLRGLRAALATKHGKEHVIAPVLAAFDLPVTVVPLDTDRFGTFDGDVPHTLSPFDAALSKARAALAAEPSAQLGIGSEGTFGAVNRELVVLVHRHEPLVLCGAANGPIFRQGEAVTSLVAAEDAAERLLFPAAGVLVMTPERRAVRREIRYLGELRAAAEQVLAEHGSAWIEPDRRAHRDPARREVIAAAARDLVLKVRDHCDERGRPTGGSGTASRPSRPASSSSRSA